MRVLAMCVANSARSQMAEGWLRALSVPSVEVHSAGSAPSRVRPEAVAVMAEVGVDLRGHRSKSAAELPTPDVVATLCAEEVCPYLPGVAERLSWATPDPASVQGTWEERLAAFRAARESIRERVEAFLTERGLRHSFAGARSAFVLDPSVTFLNHGSFGATPRAVLEARERLSYAFEAEPVRYVRSELPGAMRRAAERVAGFLGVPADELGFVDNATSGVAAVLRSLDFAPGDVILTTDHAYNAVRQILNHVCERTGARVHAVHLPFPLRSSAEVLEAVRADFPDGVKLAVFDHLTSISAVVFPVAELVELCHERGVPVLLDGAHAPGQLVLDVGAIGADFWTGNLHKWVFAPKGCAVLHVRRPWQGRIHPLCISHGYGSGMAAEFDFQGTRDYSTFLASGAGLDFAESHGWDRIRAANVLLRRQAASLIRSRLGLSDPAPEELLGCMQTFRIGPGTPEDAEVRQRAAMDQHGIQATFVGFQGQVWIRISPQIHNDLEQYRRLAAIL